MITKNQIANLIIDLKSGGEVSSSSKYDVRDVYHLIDIARDYLIQVDYNRNRAEGDYSINGDFVTAFKNVEVKIDEERNERFSYLPSRVINLPYNRGLRQVSAMQGQGDAFIISENGAIAIFDKLEAGSISNTICYLEGKKIFYKNIPENITKILIKMVASLDNIGEDDPIPIPASMELELYEKVVSLLNEEKATPQDLVSDSSSNQ